MQRQMILSLTIVCVVSSLLLAVVYKITNPKIQEDIRKKTLQNLKEVFPDTLKYDDKVIVFKSPLSFKEIVRDSVWAVYDADGMKVGIVFRYAKRGYGGPVPILCGLTLDTVVTGVRPALPVEGLKETPGLGTKILEPWFKNQFIGRKGKEVRLKRDGGKIDAITGATISSRAVADGVFEGIEKYKKYLSNENQ